MAPRINPRPYKFLVEQADEDLEVQEDRDVLEDVDDFPDSPLISDWDEPMREPEILMTVGPRDPLLSQFAVPPDSSSSDEQV